MGFEVASISGTIALNADPGVKAIRAVTDEARKMKTNVDREFAGAAASGHQRFNAMISNIRADFGKRSALKESLDVLAGAGATAGIGMATRAMKAFGDAVAEVSVKLRTHQITGMGAFSQLAGGVPVLGDAFSFGQSIRELVTGDEAADIMTAKAVENRAAAEEREFKRTQDMVNMRREEAAATREAEYALGKLASAYQRTAATAGARPLARAYAGVDAAANAEYEARIHDGALGDEERNKLVANVNVAKRVLDSAVASLHAVGGKLSSRYRAGPVADAESGVNAARGPYDATAKELAKFDAQRASAAGYRDATIAAGRRAAEAELGADLRSATRSPAEVFKDAVGDAESLFKTGVIDRDTLARAAASALVDLQKAMPGVGQRTVEGMEIRGGHVVTSGEVQQPLQALPKIAQETLDELKRIDERALQQARNTVIMTFPG